MDKNIKKIQKRIAQQKSSVAKLEGEVAKLNQKKEQKIKDSVSGDRDFSLKFENEKLLKLGYELKDSQNVFQRLVRLQNQAADQYKQELLDAQELEVAKAKKANDDRNNEIRELQKRIEELSKTVEFRDGEIAVALQKENHKLASLKQKSPLELAGILEVPTEKTESLEEVFEGNTEAGEEAAWQWKVDDIRRRNLIMDSNSGFKFLAKCPAHIFNGVIERMSDDEKRIAMNYLKAEEQGLHPDVAVDQRTGDYKIVAVGKELNTEPADV